MISNPGPLVQAQNTNHANATAATNTLCHGNSDAHPRNPMTTKLNRYLALTCLAWIVCVLAIKPLRAQDIKIKSWPWSEYRLTLKEMC